MSRPTSPRFLNALEQLSPTVITERGRRYIQLFLDSYLSTKLIPLAGLFVDYARKKTIDERAIQSAISVLTTQGAPKLAKDGLQLTEPSRLPVGYVEQAFRAQPLRLTKGAMILATAFVEYLATEILRVAEARVTDESIGEAEIVGAVTGDVELGNVFRV